MHHRKTYMYVNFQQNCINLQLAIRISKNHAFWTCTTPPPPPQTFKPILRSIGLLDNELPRKGNISTDDRWTDERTDGRTDIRTEVKKRKKNTKKW